MRRPAKRPKSKAIAPYSYCSGRVYDSQTVSLRVSSSRPFDDPIRPPKGKPGDYMIMQALMPQIVAISNCPVLFNACNNFRLKPLTLEILK